jgi:hypothetical protein
VKKCLVMQLRDSHNFPGTWWGANGFVWGGRTH